MNETLFKYLSTAENILSEGFIRATQLTALNDPFEAVYCKDSMLELLQDLEYGKEHSKEIAQHVVEVLNSIGIVSLTETRDNLLMWAHYANEHKGVVLSFHTHRFQPFGIFENIFPIQECLDLRCVYAKCFDGNFRPMKYRKTPKFQIDRHDRSYDFQYHTDLISLAFEILLQKGDEWIYEKERRAIFHLDQADRVVLIESDESSPAVTDFIHGLDVLCKRIGIKPPFNFYKRTPMENGNSRHTFDLHSIELINQRTPLASSLSRLSFDPTVLYLFKLGKSTVTEVTFGIKHDIVSSLPSIERSTVLSKYVRFSKAKLTPNSYTLVFEGLNLD